MSEYIDVTMTIKTGMARYPTDRPVEVNTVLSTEKGDIVNLTELHMAAHTGTHIDAPYHFFGDGKRVDELDFNSLIGKAKVLDFSDKQYYIDKNDLADKGIEKGDIILLKTQNSPRLLDDVYHEDFVYLNEEGAAFLAECGIATLGFDYLSPDADDDPDYPCHVILLGQGIVIIEGLNLSSVKAGEYWMIALPLKILGGDGAPARVLLKEAKD